MAKYKAYLVEFAPMTRLIVEDTGNEDLDGGWWMKYLMIPSDKVREMIYKKYGIE